MAYRYIWVQGKQYFYYDTYETWKEALKVAKRYRKHNKSRYFIMKYEAGWLFPNIKYRLYLTKVMRLLG